MNPTDMFTGLLALVPSVRPEQFAKKHGLSFTRTCIFFQQKITKGKSSSSILVKDASSLLKLQTEMSQMACDRIPGEVPGMAGYSTFLHSD